MWMEKTAPQLLKMIYPLAFFPKATAEQIILYSLKEDQKPTPIICHK